MSIVTVSEQFQPNKYLIITLNAEQGITSTANILVSDLRTNTINLVNVQKGPQGETGSVGPIGPPGKDGLDFSILPVSSGGTNNTVFNSGYLISYDGDKLSSSSYTIDDIIELASINTNAITGIVPGTGLKKTELANNNIILDIQIGDGLVVNNNTIVVDDSIARKAEIGFGDIQGVLSISKGGTNSSSYTNNRLIYFDGTSFRSFPLNTGQIVVSGAAITIEAGSGLIGGGSVNIPNGSILLQIGESADILVEENSITLSPTGQPGIYSKIQTDNKGRVITGSNLTASDIVSFLGYTPWHSGNDGSGSGLDADLLDGQDGSFYRNIANISGAIPAERLPNFHDTDKIGTKFRINTKGIIEEVLFADYADIVSGLGFRPLNAEASDTMDGLLTLNSGLDVNGKVELYDNLFLLGKNNPDILPSDPRGFTFRYGGLTSNRTGLLAYFPTAQPGSQLRLVTNVFGSSENVDIDPNDPAFQDDINGGNAETIFITENLQGDRLTVLFREIADNLYINTNQPQQILAIKEFLQGINVLGQIKFLSDGSSPTEPPFDLAGNTIKVPGLNADLLDDNDGTYYRNAANITGNFSYNNVSFDHIDGNNNYIPKFDGSNNIISSNMKQTNDGNIQVETNLIVGDSSSIESINSSSVGSNNKIYSNNSFVAGQNNTASGQNSIALNQGSVAKAKNSIALNSYGLAYLENQTAFGGFATFDNTGLLLEHGQYSSIAAYLKGTETNGSWTSLTPIIQLPRDKTVSFDIELLINKGLSSGVAHFTFSSGIVNNVTYRDPNNITNLINQTIISNSGIKKEAFNNSQIRRHLHKITYNDFVASKQSEKNQYVWSTNIPAINIEPELRYLKEYYFYNPEKVRITGTFEKNYDGSLVLDIDRPRYYNTFYQTPFSPVFFISYDRPHKAVAGSLLDVNYTSCSKYFPPSSGYIISSIIDANTLAVRGPTWQGAKFALSGGGSRILLDNTSDIDQYFYFASSGIINNTNISLTNITNSYGYSLDSFIKSNFDIKIIHNNNIYNRVITSINTNNKTIQINEPIKAVASPYSDINGSVFLVIDDWSANLFKTCDSLYVANQVVPISGLKQNSLAIFNNLILPTNVADSGAGSVLSPQPAIVSNPLNSTFSYQHDTRGEPSFSILSSANLSNIPDGQTISIAPLFNSNTGLVDAYAKNNFHCNYSSSLSAFNANTGIYVRYIKPDREEIRIFDLSYKDLDFISAPVKFSLVSGAFSDDNNSFIIKNENNRYFLYATNPLSYDTKNILSIRVKCEPSNTKFASAYEQPLYILVNKVDNAPPTSMLELDPQTALTDEPFVFSLPSGLFFDIEQEPITISATLQNSQSLPIWLSFDADNLVFSGTPSVCDIGIYSIVIKGIDPGGLSATTNLFLEVYENEYSALEIFSEDVSDRLKIKSISLSNNKVDEKFANILVGELSHDGGYNPYVIFGQGYNSASGVFVENSNMFRYAQPIYRSFSGITTISGSPGLFGLWSKVTGRQALSNNPIYASGQTRVTNVYTPTVISGTPIYHNKIFFDDVYTDWKNFAIFTGQNIEEYQLTENFGIDLRAKFIDDYSITLTHSLIQESKGLILTEENDALEHKTLLPKPFFTGYSPTAWSQNLVCDDPALSGVKIISYPKQKLDILITTEDRQLLHDEESNTLSGLIYDDRIGYIKDPIRVKKAYRENINYNSINNTNNITLSYLNRPEQDLSISNIDYVRTILSESQDIWIFDKKINNGVLYFQNLGNDNVAKLVSENRSYSGYFYSTEPLEYAILTTEDDLSIIPESKNYNGSRIEFSDRYEIIESKDVFSTNETLLSEFVFDDLVCENEDRLVIKHVIHSQNGEAYLLFPGINNTITISYPSVVSYSKDFISNQINDTYPFLGYYEPDLSVRPSSLAFVESDFYYTWGKLIPYRFSTNEYAVRLSDLYSGLTTSGSLVYSGIQPNSNNYFPEKTLIGSKINISGYCPEEYESSYINGIEIHTNNPGANYVTGLVTFYTSYAANDINISSSLDIHKDLRINDNIYLYNPISNNINAMLPSVGTYNDIISGTKNSLLVRNFFLFPSTKTITHTGSISLNLDRNHNQTVKNNDIVNLLPIQFNNVYNNSNNIRIPKNNLFTIDNISGQKIFTTDSKSYMLRPDKYLDGAIFGNYLTNGISFFGSLFHNNDTMYDIRLTSTGLIPEYKNITFEYNFASKKLSFNVQSGLVNSFDNIRLSNFQPLAAYMKWDSTKIYQTGFKVFPENISKAKRDEFIDRDYILLEKSSADLQPINFVKLTFDSDLFSNSVSGTCNLDINLANRMEKGYLINYDENLANTTGHQYINHIPGYSFSGFIPKYHNVVSSDHIINDTRIGYSSIFNTGSPLWIEGARSSRFAGPKDVGYTELYAVGSSGFMGNGLAPFTGLRGNGSEQLWYIVDSINTSGSNKKLEFLYLGHNTNNIRFFGTINSSGTGEFSISKLSLSDQLEIEKFISLGQTTGVQPFFTTGTLGSSGSFDLNTPVSRFDLFIIDLVSENTNNVSHLSLNCYAEYAADPAPLLLSLQDNSILNTTETFYPKYLNYKQNLFYILPSFHTNSKYCNLNLPYNKNTNLFYNGNIMTINNFSSINSYSLFNDQLRIRTLNNESVSSSSAIHVQKINSTNENLIITGISLDGPKLIPSSTYDYKYNTLRENTDRGVLTFGSSGYLPNTGNLSFSYHYSGSFDLINYNNIYTQIYGGYTSRWPQDFDAVLTEPPITGTYKITTQSTPCSSGKLCISIEKYSGSLIFDTDPYYYMNNSQSLVSLLDIEKSYYFDFDDYAANLSDVYKISDILSNNTITISTPYMEQYLGASGIVFIIPSKYNIKSHLNPNSGNVFLIEKPSSIIPSNRASNTINYFDRDTKKWTNIYHLTQNLPGYSGYSISINNTGTTLIYNNTSPIRISSVKTIDTNSLQTNNITNSITTNIGEVTTLTNLIISTENGSPSLSNNLLQSLPKLFVSGVSSYGTRTQGPLSQFNNYINNSGWNVNLEIQPLNKAGIYPMAIIARDETGEDVFSFNMIINDRVNLRPSYPTGYATFNETSWSLVFDLQTISDIDDSNKYIVSVSDAPSTNYNVSYHNNNKLIKIFGNLTSPFNMTGIFNPVLSISNKITGDHIVSSTGTLRVIDNLNDRPDYLPTISNLRKHYFVNLNSNESIDFSIPVFAAANVLNINLNLFGLDTYRAISYDNSTNHHIINIGNFIDTSFISDAQLSFNIQQDKYINGNPQSYPYTSNVENFSVTIYRPLVANQSYNSSINKVFDINQPWTYEFALEEGALKHRPDKSPRVKLINTPSFGDTAQENLSYRVRYRYMQNEKYWIVSLIGLPDRYGRYAPSTGNYTIEYFADDYDTGSVSGSFDITYQNVKKINFIQSNIYTTPDNEFFINADILDPAFNTKLTNNIVFNGENSLSIAQDQYKYNPYFQTWEYYATGNKLLDKWDARILLSESYSENSFEEITPSITLQCKGIATDKITAIAKVNLIELQNNNLDALDTLPIQISGVAGGSTPPNEKWTEVSGLIVEQGRRWELRFSTIFGLASPQHPPTIILSGTPSTCSGYYPDQDPFYNDTLPPETALEKCIVGRPSFNEQDKSWNFSFSGDPSCSLLGEIDFSIIAIDTNLSSTPIYIEPEDTFESIFTYIPTPLGHPGPFISQDENPNIEIDIEPFCNTYFNSYSFGPRSRNICPQITGLTGIFISGSVPSGLTTTLQYSGPEGNIFNAPLYNNTNIGKLVIQGQVLDYPKSGSAYEEILYLTVVDARGNSVTETIGFEIKVDPLDPSINTTMFFAESRPVFSPSTGNDPVEGGILVKQPAAFDQNMICLSNLPKTFNKNCNTFPVFYSGSPNNLNRFIKLSAAENYENEFETDIDNFIPPYFGASQEPNIYILSNIFSGNYFVKTAFGAQISGNLLPNYLSVNDKYIELLDNIPIGSTGLADILVEKYKSKDLSKLNNILGEDTTISIDDCLLGNGKLVQKVASPGQGPSKFGIGGLLSPAWSGYIPSGGVFDRNDVFVTGLEFIRINNNPEYSVIKYTKCQETGYFRVSGIILPPIYVEITDPVETTNSSSTIKLAPRLSYGNSPVERSKPQNNRDGSADYILIDRLDNRFIQGGTLSVSATGISSTIDILASTLNNASNTSGVIFEVKIQSDGGVFPSYDNNTYPKAIDSSYYWIHRFGFADQNPQPKDLPPVVIVEPRQINIVSGSIINFIDDNNFGIKGLAVGGYIPLSINGQNTLPFSNFTTRDYLPTISGFILDTAYSRNITTEDLIPEIGTYLVGYNVTSKHLAIINTWKVFTNNFNNFNPSDIKQDISKVFREENLLEISIQFDPIIDNPIPPNLATWTTLDTFEIELTEQEFDYSNIDVWTPDGTVSTASVAYSAIVFRNKQFNFATFNPFITNGIRTRAIIKTINKIIDKTDNTITVKHNNLLINNDQIVIVDKLNSNISSIYKPGNLIITQRNSNTLIIENDTNNIEYLNIGENIIIHKLIEDNIKTMPNNISFDKEGKYNFIISGRANILLGKYTYRIVTKENSNMPIFTLSNWSPKLYYSDITMRVNKPIEIIASNKVWLANQASWSLTLTISGGSRPALEETIDVQIDTSNNNQWTYCGFNRYPIGQDKDTYNSSQDATIITLTSNDATNWNLISSFNLKITDSTGTDTITVNRDD